MSSNPIHIVKHSGEVTVFDIDKLRSSLENSGATASKAAQIADEVSKQLFEGITTKEIYSLAHRLLKKQERSKAARYGLKKAILNLGPTGYPFESFIAEVMKHEGFQTETGQVMLGRCVQHEVDVLAYNAQEVHMMECKFHNRPGYKTDVKVPLYIKSRFEDVSSMWKNDPRFANKAYFGWVVTNSRFTSDARDFARCSGLKMISWDYPQGHSLKELVTKHALFPITALTKLSKMHKEVLLTAGVTLAKTLCETPEQLEQYGVPKDQLKKIVEEAGLICDL